MAYASVIISSSIVQYDVANIVTVSIVCALNSITISIFRSHNQPSTIYSANALSPVRRRSCARVPYSLIKLFCPANSGKSTYLLPFELLSSAAVTKSNPKPVSVFSLYNTIIHDEANYSPHSYHDNLALIQNGFIVRCRHHCHRKFNAIPC